MMAEPTANEPVVRFTITQEQHRVTAVTTNAPEVNHFLDFIRLAAPTTPGSATPMTSSSSFR